MKRPLLMLILCLGAISWISAQTTVLDFEDASTSTNFQYFGSTLDPTLNNVIANPNPSGINTSAMVADHIKPVGSEAWAGAFSNPDPTVPINLVSAAEVCIDVHMDHMGSVTLKLENSTTGAANWELTQSNTMMNAWEQLCFDVTAPSEANGDPAAVGQAYARMVLFFGLGSNDHTADQTNYFDNVVINPALVVTTVLDFEDAATSSNFQYFGSSLDPTLNNVLANPNPSGINTSAMVADHIKPVGSEAWAGAFSNPDPTVPINLVGAVEMCLDVHMDHLGSVTLKLENSTSGAANWELTQSNTTMNAWGQLCFDVTAPSEANGDPAAVGQSYARMVLFFGLGSNDHTADQTNYFDNVIIKSTSAGPQPVDITFQVDMSEYTGAVDEVYVRGTFNGFGEDNLMTDQGSGLWSTTLSLNPGPIAYKFWIKGTDTWEEFTGLEECIAEDGGYVNRSYNVSEEATLDPVAWNSCYLAGEEARLTFELGTSEIDVSPDGIWLAGGGNFDAPGGRFKMEDPDADGVYTISFPRAKGFSSFYTFANGNCPDFGCKEDIAGLPCSDPANYDDRFLPALTGDITISTCFAMCSESATACTVGTNELTVVDNIFTMTPTLVDDMTLLTFQDQSEKRNVRVAAASGKTILQQSLSGAVMTWELNAAQFPAGLYFVQVQQSNKTQTIKFLVY